MKKGWGLVGRDGWYRNSVPGRLFDDVLEEDESGVQCALDLLQEEEDLLIIWNRKSKWSRINDLLLGWLKTFIHFLCNQ